MSVLSAEVKWSVGFLVFHKRRSWLRKSFVTNLSTWRWETTPLFCLPSIKVIAFCHVWSQKLSLLKIKPQGLIADVEWAYLFRRKNWFTWSCQGFKKIMLNIVRFDQLIFMSVIHVFNPSHSSNMFPVHFSGILKVFWTS